jgi:signal peptidase I
LTGRAGQLRSRTERFDTHMTEPASLRGGDYEVASKKSNEGGLWETIKVIVQALLIALVIRTVLFQPFNIPSGSLIPTLLIGDYLFVSKYSYGYSHYSLPAWFDPAPEVTPGSRDFQLASLSIPSIASLLESLHVPPLPMQGRLFASQPKRGDIIVFKLPRDGETDYIKRLIGLPGDKIQIVNARLYINGTLVERTPLSPYSVPGDFGPPVDHYEEMLPGGVKHEIIQISGDAGAQKRPDDGRVDVNNTGVYEVPPGQYFMMGDNRDNSLDSRVPPEQGGVGFVPFDNLIGRAEVIFFSVEDGEPAWEVWRWPWIVRWHRLFQPVR